MKLQFWATAAASLPATTIAAHTITNTTTIVHM